MSQFKYWNEINSVVNYNGPITKGPQPRYERKKSNALASSNSQSISNSSSLNLSKQRSLSSSCLSISKTPMKASDNDSRGKTPLKKSKTPTPHKGARTPGGDRFIPSRVASNLDLAHYKLCQEDNETSCNSAKKDLKKVISDNLLVNQRVLAYTNKAPTAPDGFQNPMRVLYTQARTPASTKSTRYIPQAPDRILDAPNIVDDFYLNLLDWGSNNILAAALGSHVYLWNAATGNTELLMELEGNDYICSLAWIQEGDCLAVGTTQGTVELWDCSRSKRLRIMDGHSARVGSLAWNSYVVTSGCRSGNILHHDVRQRQHVITTIPGHNQEVCGLTWSTDGKLLASGGNDNTINIWASVNGGHHSETTPLHSFLQHQAAIKALAWCPWQPHILASGGGTADRHIRIWNCNSGTCVHDIDAKSQVCSLLWSSHYKELVSGHGFANNEVIIWKYPAMTKVAELKGHTARVLHLTMSPDGTTILSAGADETLRLWKCFVKDPVKEKKEGTVRVKPSALRQCIR
ncbi:cell division cycle protein 20 homolog [Euwallacea similis]|uniref:cell division cycle protein 20 homolog n=1 Tax=Euwallacea similis TaxID=1736056 RepID=UPI00344D80F7